MLKTFTLLLLVIIPGCVQKQKQSSEIIQPAAVQPIYITIGNITVPPGYTRVAAAAGSFAAWLRDVSLKKEKAVYLYNGKLKPNQSAQFAVIDIPVGSKNLQQCADVVMRLRAEYLFAQKKFGNIAFMDYSGKWYKWTGTTNRPAFDNYLQNVFGWCGSASLEKQLKPVENFNDITAGNVFIQGGFPGHAMIVVDVAVNEKGNKAFMLAQGYQPAQDIHVVNNPMNNSLNPWYEVNDENLIITPEWRFYKSHLRRW
jgi:Domain of unknown function (4846)